MSKLAELMKSELQSIGARITILKKQYRELEKENKPRYSVEQQIERLEKQKKYYQASKSEPVQLENGVIVNARLVKAYVKKLPRSAVITYTPGPSSLTVSWESFSEKAKGSFVFLDQADWYLGFPIPPEDGLLE